MRIVYMMNTRFKNYSVNKEKSDKEIKHHQKSIEKLSICHKICLIIPKSLQPNVVNLIYFNFGSNSLSLKR